MSRLTPRSSGAPTAGHQGPAGGTRYIFANRALASCRCRPLSSNVRHPIHNRTVLAVRALLECVVHAKDLPMNDDLPTDASEVATSASELATRCKQLQGPLLVEAIIERGYWHPNGFAKLTLPEIVSGAHHIRLHYWPRLADSERALRDIHSHRWRYTSIVVAGSLFVEDYIFAPNESGDTTRFLCSANDGGEYLLNPLDKGILSPATRRVLRSGQIHFGDPSTIHRAFPDSGDDALTLMFEGRVQRTESEVFRRDCTAHSQTLPSATLERAQVEAILARFTTELG